MHCLSNRNQSTLLALLGEDPFTEPNDTLPTLLYTSTIVNDGEGQESIWVQN